MRATKIITLFLILLLIPVFLFAQSKGDLKKAVSYYNKGNYSEAVKLFDPYLEKKPDPEVYFLKGYALYKMSKFNEALNSFRQAGPADPISIVVQGKDGVEDGVKEDLKKAVFYYNKSNYSEAVKLFVIYLEKKPDPEVYFLKGYALYKMDKFKEARDSFRQAYLIDPKVTVSKATDILLPSDSQQEK